MCRADNLTTFMCRPSWNLGASSSWNPLGLSRAVQELLHFYLFYFFGQECVNAGNKLYTFEIMWHILINITPWDRGYKKQCIQISHTIILLAALFENGNPWYGRTFICENSNFERLQCTGVPYSYKCHYVIVSNHMEEVQSHSEVKEAQRPTYFAVDLWQGHVSSYNLTEHEQRQVLDSKGISKVYRVFWVCSALNFMIGHKMPNIHAK